MEDFIEEAERHARQASPYHYKHLGTYEHEIDEDHVGVTVVMGGLAVTNEMIQMIRNSQPILEI